MRIAYFGHDIHDAAIARRVRALQAAGHEVTGFMMRRGDLVETGWQNIDLGQTQNAAYLQRLASIWRGTRLAAQHREQLAGADIIIARNLDMALCATRVLKRIGLHTPLVYECLDVHHKLTGKGPAARLLRVLERGILRRASLTVISSPAFERDYFARFHSGLCPTYLMENRLVAGTLPQRSLDVPPAAMKLRLGWFGVLRCQRSLDMMIALATALPNIDIHIAGKPVINGFDAAIEGIKNIRFFGSYRAPRDLPALYGGVDLVWAGDYYQADFNSRALLPNRIYEGGYFGVPAIAPAGTQTARWLEDRQAGFVIAEPVEETIVTLLRDLQVNRQRLSEAKQAVLALPEATFVEPAGAIDAMLAAALGRPASIDHPADADRLAS